MSSKYAYVPRGSVVLKALTDIIMEIEECEQIGVQANTGYLKAIAKAAIKRSTPKLGATSGSH